MKSQEHQNFENMLRAVVTAPVDTVKAELAEDRAGRAEARDKGETQERVRPIVSPGLVSSSTSRRA
jgi:hypothetical protein